MKKAVYILLTAVMLTACGNTAQTENTETQAVSRTTAQTVSFSKTTSSAKDEKPVESSTKTTAASASEKKTTSKASRAITTNTDINISESQTVTSQTEGFAEVNTEPITTSEYVTEHYPTETAVTSPVPQMLETSKQTAASTTTSALPAKITAKPKATTTAKAVTTTTTTEEIEYVEIEDVTSLKTMVENLEETDTPPKYYENIGKSLKHDGTDYGKAAAVYKWMRANGWGSCVYYSMETYFVCKGIGLECAYNFTTENGWYGHTHNVVKVDGMWYVLDTQARRFLDNCIPCVRMFDGNDNDLKPFERWIWYDYDENGEFRDWTLAVEE